MTDYGQLLPNKVVQLNDLTNITKANFTHILASAFVKVGMQFIGGWSTYDVLDPANAEHGTPGQSYEQRNFFFDFPTSETFLVDNIPYRPCVSIHAHLADNGINFSNPVWANGLGIQLGRRRADRLQLSDFRTSYYYRIDGSNFGNTNAGGAVNSYKFGMAMRFKEGAVYEAGFPYWKPFAASVLTPGSQVVPHNFKNFYVYLGKAGLFVFVGTGSAGAEFNNILSAGIMFAGGRIPGRGRIPLQDVNLNRINPTLELPMFSGVNADFFSGGVLVNPLLGIQHDLKSRPDYPAYTLIYNLENVEQPIYPSTAPNVLRSPRIVNGGGAYILSRPVIVPQYMMDNSADYVGPIDPQITGVAVRPQWADVFTAQNFRFGDRTVTTPVEYIDPQTSKHWFLVHAENTNMAYALGYDGRVIMNNVNLTQTLYGTVNVDFSVGGFAGPFPAGVTVTKTDGGPGATWTQVPSQNAVEIIDNTTTYPNHYFIIEFTPTGDPADVTYVLEWESEAPATSVYIPNVVGITAYVWDVFGNAQAIVTEYITSTPSDPQYTYRQHSAVGQLIASSGIIRFELNYYNPGYPNIANPKLRNFRIKKYRYA